MKPFQRRAKDQEVLRIFPGMENPVRGSAAFKGSSFSCALGQGGVCPEYKKREGDGKTPAGLYFPRLLLFRPDRLDKPETLLPTTALNKNDCWCDDPERPEYNRAVRLPFKGSFEKLWRGDHLYDLILVISHNDSPPRPGLGSAVFFHLARPGLTETRGCVAFDKNDFLEILVGLHSKTLIRIHAAARES